MDPIGVQKSDSPKGERAKFSHTLPRERGEKATDEWQLTTDDGEGTKDNGLLTSNS
jgi:hypothetical protein